MTQQVSDEVLGRFARQQSDWFRRVREGSLNPETVSRLVQEIIDEGQEAEMNVLPAQAGYLITVQYRGGKTISSLLRAGEYDWTNENLNDQNFSQTPMEREETEELEIELVHFDREMETDDILSGLEKRGLRPATPTELLTLGATHKDLQREFPIVALGQSWQDPDGDRGVVYLCRSGSDRDACLVWFEGGWDRDCRFAGVRK